MHRLRNRLIAAFVVATLLPLVATIWIATSLLERSLSYATTRELDELAQTLEETVRASYGRERDALRQDADAGRVESTRYAETDAAAWPPAVRAFWASDEPERFGVSPAGGDRLEYMRRRAGEGWRGVEVYTRDLRGLPLDRLANQLRDTRQLVDTFEGRDLRRGFTLTLLLLVAVTWAVSLVPLLLLARRISDPIGKLTEGLTAFADGDWSRRIDTADRPSRDEVGRAVQAFNHMADQMRQNRDRLVYLAQMASWQAIARKTAHELKNSLTPIRLTVEEIQARHPAGDRAFIDNATQIVVSEIDALERRVRAFSEFASDPPVHPELLDVNAVVSARVSLLRPGDPDITWQLRLDPATPRVSAGSDLVNGILTNLLQNAVEAVGATGTILVTTGRVEDRVRIEVHDSGPGLSAEASATLFEPSITFKQGGMGLGLSIARKNALISGGDIVPSVSELGGAAFVVTLPLADARAEEDAPR